ncbi:hypothetical protein [Marinobacterium stanieri]|uniref:Uncharacterized protein n=1 Tax=Marinobacterium stanieri TaxID=49186 RepID=A0A1N6NJT3_9GAMM|nr:hypothetical protein [Marinobacterium stanieri]SIP92340.1 hypothetical protein SAMN05421647_101372 [Marinobacterium stanieri]
MALKKSSLWERILCAKLFSHTTMNKLYPEKFPKRWHKKGEELRQKARRNLPALEPEPDDIKAGAPRKGNGLELRDKRGWSAKRD